MHVDIVSLSGLRLACVRHRGAYSAISEGFRRLGQIAGPAQLFHEDAAMVAVFHDDPAKVPEAQLRADAGITIEEGVTIPPGLDEQRLPPGRYAKTVHIGPYDGLPAVWKRFVGEWMPSRGQRRGEGPSFELYLNTPMDTPPEQLVTELYAPLT